MNNNNTENDLGINLKVDHNDHVPPNMNHHEDNTLRKTARLAKLNLIITIVGLATLGYLHFSSKSSIDESLAKSKQEIGQGLASKEELQALSTDLAAKMEGQATRISGLEVQGERFQEEFNKSAQLSARVDALQSSLKKAKPAAADTKSKAKGKLAAKAVKKGKR